MKSKILLFTWCSLLACTSIKTTVKVDLYPASCATIVNTGKIDAHEVINMQNKTTFEATEYTDCDGGKNIVIIKWEGEGNEVNIRLANQIVGNYFHHFHQDAYVVYSVLTSHLENNINTIVYEFTRQVSAI